MSKNFQTQGEKEVSFLVFSKVKAKSSYTAKAPDEISLLVDDLLFIESIDGYGNAKGTNSRSDQEGWFPLEHCEYSNDSALSSVLLRNGINLSSGSYEDSEPAPKKRDVSLLPSRILAAKKEEPSKSPSLKQEEWKETVAPDGRIYYWNTKTRETTWTKPEGYIPKNLRKDDEEVSKSKSDKSSTEAKNAEISDSQDFQEKKANLTLRKMKLEERKKGLSSSTRLSYKEAENEEESSSSSETTISSSKKENKKRELEERKKQMEEKRRILEAEKLRLEQERIQQEQLKVEQERIQREKAERERLEREKLERERLEREKLERERIESERLEKERLERERLERERLEKERLEKERLEKERLEKERLEKERLEKERIRREKMEQERLQQEKLKKEQERLQKEKVERERLQRERLEKERLERERLEQEKLEKERIEKERSEKEKIAQEKIDLALLLIEEEERLEQERLERERIEQEKLEKEKIEQEKLERERIEQELLELEQARLERERLEKEKLEKERLERERLERERLERERLERDRLERERLERDRLERERLERERLEKERLEQERITREKMEQERIKQEKIRQEQERLEKERFEKERLKRERLEKERLERERLEQERIEQELLQIERERLEMEKQEEEEKIQKAKFEQEAWELLQQERLEKEKEIEKEKLLQEKLQKQLEALEKMEKERLEKERLETLERERLEKERLEKERERLERERLERLEKEKLERLERERLERLEKEKLEREKLEKEKKFKQTKPSTKAYVPPVIPTEDTPPPPPPSSGVSQKYAELESIEKQLNALLSEIDLPRSQKKNSALSEPRNSSRSPPNDLKDAELIPIPHLDSTHKSPSVDPNNNSININVTGKWKAYTSSNGKTFYYNKVTKETTWDPPVSHQEIDFPRDRSESTEIYDPMKPRRKLREPTPGRQQIYLSILVEDGRKKKICVTNDFLIQDVIYVIADKLDLWQPEFFALSNPTPENHDRWLSPSHTLASENIQPDTNLVLKLKILKYPRKLIDPVAIRLYYSQMKKNILNGNYRCSEPTSIRLSALQLQSEYGDFDPNKLNYDSFDRDSIQTILPKHYCSMGPLKTELKRIFVIYASLKGMEKSTAQITYIELVRKKCPTFGATFFTVTQMEEEGIGQQRTLAIIEDGFLITTKKDPELYDLFSFHEIESWFLISSGIEFRISNPDKKPFFKFSTSQSFTINQLLSEYYTLLQAQLGSKLHSIKLNVTVDTVLDGSLFRSPIKRYTADPNFSRMQLFKKFYWNQCEESDNPSFIESVNSYLDNSEAMNILDLSKGNITSTQLDKISRALSQTFQYQPKRQFEENFPLNGIDLSDNPLGSDGASTIGSLLSISGLPLTTLFLNDIKLGPKGAKTLAKYLEGNHKLERIYLQNNNLSSKGAVFLLEALKKNSNILEIDLQQNDLEDKAVCNEIAELVSTKKLTGLVLANNKLGENMSIITNILSRKFTLQTLDITDIGYSSAVPLIEWAVKHTALEQLWLGGNPINEKAALLLADIVGNSYHKLNLLDISFCHITSAALLKLCSCLYKNENLEELILSGNKIGKKEGERLIDGLERHKKISILRVRDCGLSKDTSSKLLQTVRRSNTLKTLDISHNPKLSNQYVMNELDDVLSHNKILTTLNISGITFSANNITQLSNALTRNSTLKTLNLDENKLGKAIVKIAEGLKKSNIEEVTLKHNSISVKDLREFFSTLGTGSKLTKLSVQKNSLQAAQFKDDLKSFPNLDISF